jgi:hypothetical protein
LNPQEKQVYVSRAPKDNAHAWQYIAWDATGSTFEAMGEMDDAFHELMCLVETQAVAQKGTGLLFGVIWFSFWVRFGSGSGHSLV